MPEKSSQSHFMEVMCGIKIYGNLINVNSTSNHHGLISDCKAFWGQLRAESRFPLVWYIVRGCCL